MSAAQTTREVMIPGDDVWTGCVDQGNGTLLNAGGDGYRDPAAQVRTSPETIPRSR